MKFSMLLIFGLVLIGMSLGGEVALAAEDMKATASTKAIVVLHPTQGSDVNGIVRFERKDKSVGVTGEIRGLAAGSKHGFHVHEYGDCSAADATSAGGHYNPENMPHGGQKSEKRHVGDLGNIEVDSNGTAKLDLEDPKLVLEGSHSIIGRSVIVHAKPDDLVSQPTGEAGARLACGVIGTSK